MTKKHFIFAAAQVKAMREQDRGLDADVVMFRYIELFRHFNPRFDKERFISACEVKQKT